jgi:hypothetical protein
VYDAEGDESPAQQVGSWTVDVPTVTITGIYPTSGAAGSLVTITGSNFGPGTLLVMFNGMSSGAALSSWTSTSISAFVPTGAATGGIEVDCAGGNAHSPVFTVTIAPAPIVSFIVQPAPLYPGTWGTIQIYGSNFGSAPGYVNICPGGANPCVLPDVDYFPCNAIATNGQIACASYAYDVWQNNFIQARVLLSNGYEYYPVWQIAVQAAGAWISNSLAAFAVTPPPNCAVPVNFHQVGYGQDMGNITYLTNPFDPRTDTHLPTVELRFNYLFESSTHNLSDLQGCSIGEIVTQQPSIAVPFAPSSPPFPSNTYMWVSNPFPADFVASTLTNGLLDRHDTVGYWVTPYTSNANYVSTQYYRYKCGCVNNNTYVNFAGPLMINHALTPNGDGTWRYAVCKPNIAPYNQSTSSCANKNPLP